MTSSRSDFSLAELDGLLERAIAASPSGATATQARRALPAGLRPKAQVVTDRLRALATRGVVHRWPGRTERYAIQPLESLVRAQVLAAFAREAVQTPAQIRRTVIAPGRPLVEGVLASLVRDGRAHVHPPVGGGRVARSANAPYRGGRTLSYGVVPPDPRDYLSADLDALLAKVVQKGFTPAAVREAVRRHVDDGPGGAQDRVAAAHTADPGATIVEAMIALNPQAREGALVYIPHLRHAVSDRLADRLAFDRAILGLHARGAIQLQAHPVPSELKSEERAAMVPDGVGGFYMAAGLRG